MAAGPFSASPAPRSRPPSRSSSGRRPPTAPRLARSEARSPTRTSRSPAERDEPGVARIRPKTPPPPGEGAVESGTGVGTEATKGASTLEYWWRCVWRELQPPSRTPLAPDGGDDHQVLVSFVLLTATLEQNPEKSSPYVVRSLRCVADGEYRQDAAYAPVRCCSGVLTCCATWCWPWAARCSWATCSPSCAPLTAPMRANWTRRPSLAPW